MKKAFTIIELIMVVAIIGILLAVVATAATASFRNARVHQAKAIFKMISTGLATHYAREGDWPFSIPESSTSDTYELTSSDVRRCVQALVDDTKEGNPVIDVSGLWVTATRGINVPPGSSHIQALRAAGGARGMDFTSAIRGTKRTSPHTTSELDYGYPDPESGLFLPFRMVYAIPADSLSVGGWSDELSL